jgi:hypothetical protein
VADESTLFMLEFAPLDTLSAWEKGQGAPDDPLMNSMARLAVELHQQLERIEDLRIDTDRKPMAITFETYLPEWPEPERFPGDRKYAPGAYEWIVLGLGALSVALQAAQLAATWWQNQRSETRESTKLELRVKHRKTTLDLTNPKITVEEIEAFLRQNGDGDGN